MAKLTEVKAYFQATCFPQPFVGVQIGFGGTATVEPGETAADVEARLYARSKARVEREINVVMQRADDYLDDSNKRGKSR